MGNEDERAISLPNDHAGGVASAMSSGAKGSKGTKGTKVGLRRRSALLKPSVLSILRTSASCAFFRRPLLLHPSMVRPGGKKRAGN